jgi:hypothetical protein
MSRVNHPRDGIHDLVSGRLEAAERATLMAHLESCDECRAERELLEKAKLAVRQLRQTPLAPFVPPQRRSRTWMIAAAMLIVAIALTLLLRAPQSLDPALRLTSALIDGEATLTLAESDLIAVENRLLARGADRPVRVIDLQMMGWSLVQADVVNDPPQRTVFVYRHADGRVLICQMWRGSLSQLPRPVAVHRHREFAFQDYQHDTISMVAWEERGFVCVLGGRLPLDQIRELAIAKAMS